MLWQKNWWIWSKFWWEHFRGIHGIQKTWKCPRNTTIHMCICNCMRSSIPDFLRMWCRAQLMCWRDKGLGSEITYAVDMLSEYEEFPNWDRIGKWWIQLPRVEVWYRDICWPGREIQKRNSKRRRNYEAKLPWEQKIVLNCTIREQTV